MLQSGQHASLIRFTFAFPSVKSRFRFDGGRSSMVELQIVILAVAGSSPVGHPFLFRFPIIFSSLSDHVTRVETVTEWAGMRGA